MCGVVWFVFLFFVVSCCVGMGGCVSQNVVVRLFVVLSVRLCGLVLFFVLFFVFLWFACTCVCVWVFRVWPCCVMVYGLRVVCVLLKWCMRALNVRMLFVMHCVMLYGLVLAVALFWCGVKRVLIVNYVDVVWFVRFVFACCVRVCVGLNVCVLCEFIM